MEHGLAVPTMKPTGTRAKGKVKEIRDAIRRGKVVLAASDGSRDEKCELAGWGLQVLDMKGEKTDAKGSVPGADQTSWASEVDAITVVLEAAEDIEENVEITMAIDCQSVQRTLQELIARKEDGKPLNSHRNVPKTGFREMGKDKTEPQETEWC